MGKLERGDEDLSLSRLRQFATVLECRVADLLPAEDVESPVLPLRDPQDGGQAFKRFDPSRIGAVAWPIRLRRDGGDAFSPQGCLWFGCDFLAHLCLDPRHCEVVDVRDSSMVPAFPAGSACLIDHRRQKRLPEAFYGVEQDGDLFIRRARKKGTRWHLMADNPEADWDVPWPADMKSLGRVVWTARVTVS